MKDLNKKLKPTLESLIADNQVVTGYDLIKRKKIKDEQLAAFEEASEFEKRHKKPRQTTGNTNK